MAAKDNLSKEQFPVYESTMDKVWGAVGTAVSALHHPRLFVQDTVRRGR